jgi:hypothetical protein
MNQKGNAPILILIGIFILVGLIGGAYYFGMKKDGGNYKSSTNVQQTTTASTSNKVSTNSPNSSSHSDDTTSNLKTFTSTSRGISLKYPANWITSDDEFVSEKPFAPGEQDRTKTYNIIEIQKYTEQMYVGYTNAEWFNKVYSSTSSIGDQREKRTKITSGAVTSGEQYVIFTNEPSTTAQAEGFKQVKAYILKGQTIYQLTLDMYDQNGLETFKQIIPTATVK